MLLLPDLIVALVGSKLGGCGGDSLLARKDGLRTLVRIFCQIPWLLGLVEMGDWLNPFEPEAVAGRL
jgi:hypothetical protein